MGGVTIAAGATSGAENINEKLLAVTGLMVKPAAQNLLAAMQKMLDTMGEQRLSGGADAQMILADIGGKIGLTGKNDGLAAIIGQADRPFDGQPTGLLVIHDAGRGEAAALKEHLAPAFGDQSGIVSDLQAVGDQSV